MVVVGAGLAGLTAARTLMNAGKTVLVLEAQDRVGGRTWSQRVGENDFIDIGGQWIGKGHDRMYALVREAGLQTFPTFTAGQSIFRHRAHNKRYQGEAPPMGLFALLAASKAIQRLDHTAATLSLDAPWQSRDAWQLDNQSLESWIDATVANRKARTFLKRAAEGELCQPVSDISALQALAAANGTGSFSQAEKVQDGALRDRILGGAQGVSHFLHRQLHTAVKLNTPVSFVTQLADHVQVGNEHFSVGARKVVITAPLPVVAKIQFTPELPEEKRMLIGSMTMGTVLKCHAVYPTPFWRDSGLNGASTCLDEVVELSVDNSVPGSARGILTSLIHADRAKQLLRLSPEARKQTLLAGYTHLFGEQAATPLVYHDYSFSDNPWVGGAYSGFFKPGIFSKYGAHHAKACGHIHWAGTETALQFRGFMEGAVLSGERVARELLVLLKS